MKKLKQKIVSIMLIAMLLVMMLPTAVFAATPPKVSAGTAKQELIAGETVDVDVTLSDNPGIIGGIVKIVFESTKLKLTGVKNTAQTITSDYNGYSVFPITSGRYTLSWDGDLLSENITANGVIATLTFEVLDSATVGDSTIEVSDISFVNYDADDVTGTGENGNIELYSKLTGDQTITMGTKPASGAAPGTVAATGTNFTVGFDNWKEQGVEGAVATFAAGKTYTAECTLTANTGYVFAAGATAAIAGTDNGDAGTSTVSSDGKTLKFPYTFVTPTLPAQVFTTGFDGTVDKVYGDAAITDRTASLTMGDGEISYKSSDTSVATVVESGSGAGTVTIIGAGDTTITATAAGTATFAETSVSYDLHVDEKTLTNLGYTGVTVTKEYDGTTNAGAVGGTAITFDGIVGTDDVSIKAVAGDYENKNAETGKTVILTLSLDGAKKENYKLDSYTHSFNSAAITAAAQTITAATPKTIVKNGVGIDISSWASSNAPGATLVYSLDGTPVGISLTGTTLTAAADTTTTTFNVKVNSGAVNVDGTGDDEYSAALEKTIVVNVTTKEDAGVTISGTVPTGKTYGDANFTLRATKTCPDGTNGQWQWTSSDDSILEIVSGANTAVATIKVKKADTTGAAISVTYTSDSHYDIETTASIPVAKKPVTVAPKNFTITKGSAIPTFELSYVGLVGSDVLTPNATPDFTCFETDGATPVSTTTAAGTYTITWTNMGATTFTGVDNYDVNKTATGTLTIKNPSSSGGFIPSVQKPEIVIIGSGKAPLSTDGTVATITADEGYELVSVVLNGKDMGTVDKLTGLKTGDKAVITFQKKADDPSAMVSQITAKIGKLQLIARSSKTAKKNVKVVLKTDAQTGVAIKDIEDAGYTVKYKFYRSKKKSAGYKAMLTKSTKTYINTLGKKGTMYYYKVRVMVYDEEGKLVAQTALKQCKYACRRWSK